MWRVGVGSEESQRRSCGCVHIDLWRWCVDAFVLTQTSLFLTICLWVVGWIDQDPLRLLPTHLQYKRHLATTNRCLNPPDQPV